MGVVIRQSLKGTFVNYIGVVLGIFVQFYIVAKYLDPEVIGSARWSMRWHSCSARWLSSAQEAPA